LEKNQKNNEENKIVDVEQFFTEVENSGIDGFKRINGTDHVEHKTWDTPVGTWQVSVVRGKILQKATFSRALIKTKHPDTGQETSFDAIQLSVYPASPKIPVLLYVHEHMISEEDSYSGMVDVAPVVHNEEDLNLLGGEIKKLSEKHGRDYEAMRQKVAGIYKLEQWEKPVNAGVGFDLSNTRDGLDLITEAGLLWLKLYFGIVEKRQNEPFDEKDLTLRNTVWNRLLEYYLLGDRSIVIAAKLGVPIEPMTLSLAAPTIRY
jgi:coproporphyrinogen III oxidase